MGQITHLVTIESATCPACGTVFGMEANLQKRLREDHSTFYCPNGHSQYYPAKSKVEVLQDELTRERAAHDQTKADRDSKERKLNRVSKGVCPCCNRTFQNLQLHMKTKHPKFK